GATSTRISTSARPIPLSLEVDWRCVEAASRSPRGEVIDTCRERSMAERFDLGIVVPLYNKRATVRRSVARLLEQTRPPAQVVVVDDGSTDGSPDELALLAGPHTLLRQANAGPSAARNRGVAELRTEWVGFSDADDLWTLDRAERLGDFLSRHPGVDWLT